MPKYKFKITLDSDQVSGTSHTNFPYLFSQDTSNIPSGFWNHVSESNGLDIKFYSSDNTELKREIVNFDSAGQKVEAWVQIPTLSGTSDTVIWCHYGGGSLSSDPGIWTDLNAGAVWHYQNSLSDSSSNNNTITNFNMTYGSSSGLVDQGAYSGQHANQSYFDAGNDSSLQPSTLTVSGWFYVTTESTIYHLIAQDAPYANKKGYNLFIHSGNLYFRLADVFSQYTVSTSFSLFNTWFHAAGSFDGFSMRLYLNGVEIPGGTAGLAYNSSKSTWIGRGEDNPTNYYDGTLDEVRIYNRVLSSDWIATEFSNQDSPGTFSSAGSEQPVEEVAENINVIWIPGM